MQKNNALSFALILLLSVLLSDCSSNPNNPVTNNKTDYDLGDGYKLYDLIPVFISYAETGANKNQSERLTLWNTMLEQKYPDFFNQVIYKNLTDAERDNYKNFIMNQFWQNIVPQQLNTLRMLDQVAAKKIIDSRVTFKTIFPDFKPNCNYYQTISFSFTGKAVNLNEKLILVFGLENFVSGDIQLDFTIANQQFRYYHATKGFYSSGELYQSIWTAGMAARAQVLIYPGNYTYSQVLNFPQSRVEDIIVKWDTLVKNLQTNIFSTDSTVNKAFLVTDNNTLGIPPACGYYLGLRIVMKLLEDGNNFTDMVGWTTDQVQAKMQEVLSLIKSQ